MRVGRKGRPEDRVWRTTLNGAEVGTACFLFPPHLHRGRFWSTGSSGQPWPKEATGTYPAPHLAGRSRVSKHCQRVLLQARVPPDKNEGECHPTLPSSFFNCHSLWRREWGDSCSPSKKSFFSKQLSHECLCWICRGSEIFQRGRC